MAARLSRISAHAQPSAYRADAVCTTGESTRWYWLVDPEWRSVEIWELGADGRYVRACAATRGKIDPVPGCDGLVLDLDVLWAKVDDPFA